MRLEVSQLEGFAYDIVFNDRNFRLLQAVAAEDAVQALGEGRPIQQLDAQILAATESVLPVDEQGPVVLAEKLRAYDAATEQRLLRLVELYPGVDIRPTYRLRLARADRAKRLADVLIKFGDCVVLRSMEEVFAGS